MKIAVEHPTIRARALLSPMMLRANQPEISVRIEKPIMAMMVIRGGGDSFFARLVCDDELVDINAVRPPTEPAVVDDPVDVPPS